MVSESIPRSSSSVQGDPPPCTQSRECSPFQNLAVTPKSCLGTYGLRGIAILVRFHLP